MIKKLVLIAFILFGSKVFATDYYVSTTGNNSNDGLSEATAWRSITFAASSKSPVKPGDIIYVKAGNYGAENVDFEKSGKRDMPISFIGYKTSPGDITSMYYSYRKDKPLDPSEMPLLFGGDRDKGMGFKITSKSYINLKNFQISDYAYCVFGQKVNNVVLDNIISGTAGGETKSNGFGIFFNGDNDNIKIQNCLVFDANTDNLLLYANNSTIENTKSVCGRGLLTGQPGASTLQVTDYYIIFRGDNNIIRNNYVERIGNLAHGGHGIGTKAKSSTKNCIIENNTVVNVAESIFMAYEFAQDNIIRKNIVKGISLTDHRPTAFVCRDGATNNIFENNKSQYTNAAITMWRSAEFPQGSSGAKGNVFRNNLFLDTKRAVFITSSGKFNGDAIINNVIENNTFTGLENERESEFFRTNVVLNVRDNVFRNNIVANFRETLKGIAKNSDWTQSYNNYYNCNFPMPIAEGNITGNPKFEKPADGNYHLASGSSAIDTGTDRGNVMTDFDGVSRPQGGKYDIGAFEKKNDNSNPVTGYAGDDVSICAGSSTTLTASGGTSYVWNTGETTASITVSPTETTTYTVTVSEGSDSDSDEVIVTVETSPSVSLGDDITICEGEDITLTAEGNGDFLWSTGETTASITVNPTETTTYTVTADACNTSVTDEIIVNVTPGITLDAGDDVTLCSGENITLTAIGNGDFLWNTGETTASITVSPTETTTYTVTSSSGNCSLSDEVIVTVETSPSVSLGDDITICEGEDITLTAEGNGDFLWSTGETTASITVNPTETTTYTVTADACNTSVTDEIIVNVTPGINLNVSDDVSICEGESIVLTAEGNGDFLWSTGETTPSITVSPDETILYTVTVTSGSCSLTDDIFVTVNELPVISLESNEVSICEGEEVTLTADSQGNLVWSTGESTSSITVSPTITTIYTVTTTSSCSTGVTEEIIVNVSPAITLDAGDDVTICSGENITLTAVGNGDFLWNTGETTASITVNPSITTVYNVTSVSGECSLSDEVIVTVETLPSVSLGDDIAICLGENITLTASGNGNFLWNTGETTASITVNPTETTTYSVTASNPCGTSDVSDEIVITVNDLPEISAGEDVTIETGSSTILTATGEGNFLWSTGETTPSITVSPDLTTTYTVSTTAGNSCSSEDSVIVIIEGSPVNDDNTGGDSNNADPSLDGYGFAGPDIEICLNSTDGILTATGGEYYLWSTGETTASITVNPTETTTYAVTRSTGGKTDTDDVIVFVDDECSGIENRSITKEIKVYPNPTQGLLHIDLSGYSNDLNITIFSLNGKLLYSESVNNNSPDKVLKRNINLSKYGKGVYFIRLVNENLSTTKKVLVI